MKRAARQAYRVRLFEVDDPPWWAHAPQDVQNRHCYGDLWYAGPTADDHRFLVHVRVRHKAGKPIFVVELYTAPNTCTAHSVVSCEDAFARAARGRGRDLNEYVAAACIGICRMRTDPVLDAAMWLGTVGAP